MAVGSASTLPVTQEHECFQEELRKAQRKLLKVSRDKRWDTVGVGVGRREGCIPAGVVAPVDLHSDPILGSGPRMHGAWLGADMGIQRAS